MSNTITFIAICSFVKDFTILSIAVTIVTIQLIAKFRAIR